MWCERDSRSITLFFIGSVLAVAAGVLVAYIDYAF